jgi:hypothetical protein
MLQSAIDFSKFFMANRADWMEFWIDDGDNDQSGDEAAHEFPRPPMSLRPVPPIVALRALIQRARENEEIFERLAKMYRSMMSRSWDHYKQILAQYHEDK